jgi:sulfite reductase (NADPH) hemoprotein beta-component
LVVPSAFLEWLETNIRHQRQPGYAIVTATLPLGDVTAAQMRAVARIAERYGDGAVRTTHDQDLLFRWIRHADVWHVYGELAAAGLGLPGAGTIADVTSCPGAESCRLAVTQSRGLGRLLESHLRARPDVLAAARGLSIKISGCPNGCGLHHVSGLGFQGSVRRLGAKVVPQYFVLVGGGVGPDGAAFGRLAAKIPARRIPDAVERLVRLYAAERREAEPAPAFFQRIGTERVSRALADLERLRPEDAVPADFVDLGEEAEFAPEVLEGECSA